MFYYRYFNLARSLQKATGLSISHPMPVKICRWFTINVEAIK